MSCLSGKVQYQDRRSAQSAFNEIRERRSRWPRMKPYKCDICASWHLTTVRRHLPRKGKPS